MMKRYLVFTGYSDQNLGGLGLRGAFDTLEDAIKCAGHFFRPEAEASELWAHILDIVEGVAFTHDEFGVIYRGETVEPVAGTSYFRQKIDAKWLT